MKKYLLLINCFAATTICLAQTSAQIDSLTMKMCKTLENNINLTDSIRMQSAYRTHLPEFLEKFKIDSEEKFNEVYDRIHYRFQKNCNLAVEIFGRLDQKNSKEWKHINGKPKQIITKTQCRDITRLKKFYYIEPSKNDKTVVTIDNGIWLEEFADGTYSKLNFKWTSDCEFEIEFIDSNNESRKNLSYKGDKYQYGIYNRKGNDFEIWVADNDGKPVQSFWLHAIKK
jgi:hypothetical protein